MTRINCIPPEELTGRHLVAEYRELPRIFGLVEKAITRGENPNDPRNPTTYRLGTGHVRFFYSRLQWLLQRQRSLIEEMMKRGYQPTHDATGLGEGIPMEWWGDWSPDEHSMMINRERIAERLQPDR